MNSFGANFLKKSNLLKYHLHLLKIQECYLTLPITQGSRIHETLENTTYFSINFVQYFVSKISILLIMKFLFL